MKSFGSCAALSPGRGPTTGAPESVQGPAGRGAVAMPIALSFAPARRRVVCGDDVVEPVLPVDVADVGRPQAGVGRGPASAGWLLLNASPTYVQVARSCERAIGICAGRRCRRPRAAGRRCRTRTTSRRARGSATGRRRCRRSSSTPGWCTVARSTSGGAARAGVAAPASRGATAAASTAVGSGQTLHRGLRPGGPRRGGSASARSDEHRNRFFSAVNERALEDGRPRRRRWPRAGGLADLEGVADRDLLGRPASPCSRRRARWSTALRAMACLSGATVVSEGSGVAALLDVVEADDRHVLGHAQPGVGEPADRAEGEQVVEAEDRVGRLGQRQQRRDGVGAGLAAPVERR